MGINGLLPALKPIAKQVHVSKYKGQKAAVDGYSWLHKGAYCCARELCEGSWTDKFVTYFVSRVQLLRSNGIEPVVVFDGGRLPIKGQEEQLRHRARKEARDKAAAHLAAGNIAAAVECYQRCVDITPAMAKQVIEELKVQGVSFIVAPYEADAQMAYLAKRGDVQLVVTEDSDLLAYGCPRVLYKLDRSGSGEEFSLSDLRNCSSLPLSSFTSDQFLQLCVMAGCDFLAQLPGIGLKKAHGLLRKYQSFTKVLKMLRFNGTKVPAEYEGRFQMALWAFRHCRVYCPTAKAMQHLTPLPAGGIGAADVDVPAAIKQLEQEQQQQQLDFLGPDLPQNVAQGIAEGRLDPSTHKPFDLAAIYAGCRKLPPHIAAQLDAATGAVPHLLGYHQSQHATPSAHGAASGGGRSGAAGAAAAAVSGGARGARVGLSRKHAAARGQQKLNWAAGTKESAAGTEAKAAAVSTNSTRKKATLGIAKFFSAPCAAAAAAAGVHQPTDAGAAAAATAAAAAPAAEPAAAAPNMQNSIRQALHALRQQQQQRLQQEQAEKLQLLTEIKEHELQTVTITPGAAAAADYLLDTVAAADMVPFQLPAAKRCRIDAEANHLLMPSVGNLCGSNDGPALDTAAIRAPDTSLLLDQQQQDCAQPEDSGLIGSLQQQQGSIRAVDVQYPMAAAGEDLHMLHGHTGFLEGLGQSDEAAPLAAAPDISDGFGPAAAAAVEFAADIDSSGNIDINQHLEGPDSLPSSGPSTDPVGGFGDQPLSRTGMGVSLGSGISGSLGLDNGSIDPSMDPSMDSSLGLPSGSGGRGAAVSALTALFKGVQQQQQPVAHHRTAERFFGPSQVGRVSSQDAASQQSHGLLGSCPSGSMLGLGANNAGALGTGCRDFLGSAGADSQGLGSCGIGGELGSLEGGSKQQQLGAAWYMPGAAGSGLGGSSSFMTPQCPEEQDGEEEEVISPPRPHELALGGSSSQPWKRLQQSLRGLRGRKSSGMANGTAEPIEPGSSLQRLRNQLGLRGRRSRLSNQAHSSLEDGLGSGLGIGSLSDGIAGDLGQLCPADTAGDMPAGCSMGSGDFDDLGLEQQEQPVQKRRCSGFPSRLLTQQGPAPAQKQLEQQQQQHGDFITIPDSQDEGGGDTAAAAAAEGPRPTEAGGPVGDSSTDGSSLDASNDENAAPDIHSIAHVRKYARLATKVVDRVQRQQQQPVLQQTQQQQQQQQRRVPLGTCGAVGNAAAAAGVASQALGRSSMKLGLPSSSKQPAKGGRAKQRPGQRKNLTAELSTLKYDPSMFVPVQPLADDLTEQQNDNENADIDSSCDVVGLDTRQQRLGLQHASQARPSQAAARTRSMFGIKAGTAGRGSLAAKPFKAPWLSQAAASGAGGKDARVAGDEGVFGAFGGFACGR